MKLTLTLKNWEEIFYIHNIYIIDELSLKDCVDNNTEATLNLTQISRLSPLDAVKVCELVKSIKGNYYEV